MFYEEPTFWINIGFVIVGITYGIYYYVKKKNLTPLYKVSLLLLECLKDGVITKDEWIAIKDAIAKILDAEIHEHVIEDCPEPPAKPAISLAQKVIDGMAQVKDELDF